MNDPRCVQGIDAAGFGRRAARAFTALVNEFKRQHWGRLTQGVVADRAREYDPGIDDSSVSRWLNGESLPQTPLRVVALARVLGVDPGWLLFGKESTALAPEEDQKRPAMGPAQEFRQDLDERPLAAVQGAQGRGARRGRPRPKGS